MPDFLAVIKVLAGGLGPAAAGLGLGRLLLGSGTTGPSTALAAGLAGLGTAVYFLLLAGLAKPTAFVLLTLSGLVALWRTGRSGWPPALPWAAAICCLVYFLVYLPHALAPEIQSDALTYHLTLAREARRSGGFPARVAFYEILPQGMEALYAWAYAFGRHSAPKLLHFIILCATIPLIVELGKRFRAPWAGWPAAVLYAATPIVGVSGTSGLTDAAQVFFLLAAVVLLEGERGGSRRAVFAAGLAAGFCYAVKITGLMVPFLGLAWLVLRCRWRGILPFALGAFVTVAPWMGRALVLTGNPVAPVGNAWFPNPYFHVSSERELAEYLRDYGGVKPAEIPLELTVEGERLQGLLGPVWLLAPLGMLALRRKEGWALWGLAAALAAPWWLNIGTRFLMPALPFSALALLSSLPRWCVWPVAAAHAILSLPWVIPEYAAPGALVLRGWPWEAALRIESEDSYLARESSEYRVAKMLTRHVPAGARVLDLGGAPYAYVEHELVGAWQCAEGERVTQALKTGAVTDRGQLMEWRGAWAPAEFQAVRFRQLSRDRGNWRIQEVSLRAGEQTIRPSPAWQLEAWPFPWDAPFALDGNLTSGWSSWEPMGEGMYYEIEFDRPVRLDGARLVERRESAKSLVAIYGRAPDGTWREMPAPTLVARPGLNMRRAAMSLVKEERIGWILAPGGSDAYGLLGQDLAANPSDWGVEAVDSAAGIALFRVQ